MFLCLILQNSRSNYVRLSDELEALELYIKMEQMRLRNSFQYEIEIEEKLTPETYEIPPMLIPHLYFYVTVLLFPHWLQFLFHITNEFL